MSRLWHSQAHMPSVRENELVIERGEGAYIWDEAGNRYLDVPASLWYCNVGHGRREIADAVYAQLRRLPAYHSFQEFATRPAIELAERLAALSPVEDGRVFLGSGGGDAVEVAGKLARRYWAVMGRASKRTIITREKSYHGLHGIGTSIAGMGFNREGYGTLVEQTMRVDTLSARALEDAIVAAGPDNVAAFFCEPVVGGGGIIFPPEGYLAEAAAVCRAFDVLFVADEVITGFGRAGAMFASERFGIVPDMLLFAKGVTSGYLPVGGVIVGPRVAEPFWRDGSDLVFHHGLTYSGHSAACAAALKNLDILESEGLVDRVRGLEPAVTAAFAELADHPLVVDVRTGAGLLAGVQLVDTDVAQTVASHCLAHGVIMRLLLDATLQVSPPFVIEPVEIDLIAATIRAGLDLVLAEREHGPVTQTA